jgi:hypothetical protein
VAAPVQRTPGRRPVPVAVDTHRLRQCQPSGHQPSRHRPCGHRPRFWEQQRTAQGVRGVRFRSHPDTGRSVRLGQDAADRSRRCGAMAGPRRSDLLVCAGQVARSTQPAENGYRDAWTPDAACRTVGAGTPRDCGHPRPPQGMGALWQRPRWAAVSRTVHHPGSHVRPERDPNVRYRPARPADRQIRRLVLYVHTMPLSAVCAAQVRGRVQPAPDNPSGDAWWTATRTTTTASAPPRWPHEDVAAAMSRTAAGTVPAATRGPYGPGRSRPDGRWRPRGVAGRPR